jgi:hypothetical protein
MMRKCWDTPGECWKMAEKSQGTCCENAGKMLGKYQNVPAEKTRKRWAMVGYGGEMLGDVWKCWGNARKTQWDFSCRVWKMPSKCRKTVEPGGDAPGNAEEMSGNAGIAKIMLGMRWGERGERLGNSWEMLGNAGRRWETLENGGGRPGNNGEMPRTCRE